MADTILMSLMVPVMDVVGDRVVHSDGKERLDYWIVFKTLFDVFPHNDIQYGRIYNRLMIGNLLVVLTRAKELEQGYDIPLIDDSFPDSPLSSWRDEDWEMFDEYLHAIGENLKRKDVDATPFDPENREIDAEVAQDDSINNNMEKINLYIQINKAVSPIRNDLTKQIDDQNIDDDAHPKLDSKLVAKVWENACNEEDVAISEQIFRKLFQETQIKYPDTPPKMKTIGELRKTFREKPFTFDRLLNRIELLMDRWCDLVFDEPELNNFFFQDEEIIDEASQDVIHRLREARQALREEGQDPLEESIRLANAITGQTTVQIPRRLQTRQGDSQTERRAGSGLYKKRTTAVRLEFEENEDMDSTDQNADGTHHLSRLPIRAALEGSEDGFSPSRKKRRNSQKKKYEGRRPWSAEEKGAIIEGIREFGKGSWAMIKEKYEVLFELRTSGQIKDCFRSMLKRGELPADVLEES